MTMVRAALRFSLTLILSRLAAPYVRGVFDRVAKRAPKGSILESVLLELSASYSAVSVRVGAQTLAGVMLESGKLLFMLAGSLRLKPANRVGQRGDPAPLA